MKIEEAIQSIRSYCSDIDAFTGKPIDPKTTRDQVLYGERFLGAECTGIITCIWPTADIIKRAQSIGANLIVSHEAIFWNHGDRRDILAGNRTFQAKCRLLDPWGGVVWRCHDAIHAGVPLEADGSLADGIFFGFAEKLGWLDFRIDKSCLDFMLPEPIRASMLASRLVETLGLSGTRIIGDRTALVQRIRIPIHILGMPEADTSLINEIDGSSIDCLLAMELIDFTVSEYIRDAAMLGAGKCAIHLGHFNLEEPGMEYMAEWIPKALAAAGYQRKIQPSVSFLPMGDTYGYIACHMS